MLNCVYHPYQEMRVVDDNEYEQLLSTGEWFKHPNEAKKVREDHEKRLYEGKQRKRKIKQEEFDAGS